MAIKLKGYYSTVMQGWCIWLQNTITTDKFYVVGSNSTISADNGMVLGNSATVTGANG
ncbi:MAG: hypothetical protein ACLRU1_04990 [Veillonella parvula]